MATDILTPVQAAKKLKVTPTTVRRWCREGHLKHIRTPGGQIRIWRDQIDSLLERAPVESAV